MSITEYGRDSKRPTMPWRTTAGYLHVRAERLAQIQSPLGLLDLKSPLIPA